MDLNERRVDIQHDHAVTSDSGELRPHPLADHREPDCQVRKDGRRDLMETAMHR
jgi:hypothetical protein